MLFKYKSTLYLCEFKFSPDKVNTALNGICCLNFKMYAERTINFLKKKRKRVNNIEDEITDIVLLSIGFEEKNSKTSLETRLITKKSLKLDAYKNNNFVIEIRKNYKHFLKCMDFDSSE